VLARERVKVSRLELIVANQTVALMVSREGRIHLRICPCQERVELKTKLVLEAVFLVEPVLHAVHVPIIMSCDNDQTVEVECVQVLQLLDSGHNLTTHLETLDAPESLVFDCRDHHRADEVVAAVFVLLNLTPTFVFFTFVVPPSCTAHFVGSFFQGNWLDHFFF